MKIDGEKHKLLFLHMNGTMGKRKGVGPYGHWLGQQGEEQTAHIVKAVYSSSVRHQFTKAGQLKLIPKQPLRKTSIPRRDFAQHTLPLNFLFTKKDRNTQFVNYLLSPINQVQQHYLLQQCLRRNHDSDASCDPSVHDAFGGTTVTYPSRPSQQPSILLHLYSPKPALFIA